MNFVFQQKTSYVMRIMDCSLDVCSSDLLVVVPGRRVRCRMWGRLLNRMRVVDRGVVRIVAAGIIHARLRLVPPNLLPGLAWRLRLARIMRLLPAEQAVEKLVAGALVAARRGFVVAARAEIRSDIWHFLVLVPD